nr:hypothetical protein CFP56_50731 [Quercus suber]
MLEKEGFEVHNIESKEPVLQEEFKQETRKSTKEGKKVDVTIQQAGAAKELMSGQPFDEVLGEIDKEIGKYDSKRHEAAGSEVSMGKENHMGQQNINEAKLHCSSSTHPSLHLTVGASMPVDQSSSTQMEAELSLFCGLKALKVWETYLVKVNQNTGFELIMVSSHLLSLFVTTQLIGKTGIKTGLPPSLLLSKTCQNPGERSLRRLEYKNTRSMQFV